MYSDDKYFYVAVKQCDQNLLRLKVHTDSETNQSKMIVIVRQRYAVCFTVVIGLDTVRCF